jgi:1,4-alpha-glucan branching enzyme
MARPDYRVGVPKKGSYTLILDNQHGLYHSTDKPPVLKAVEGECDGQPYSVALPLSAYGTAILRFNG